MNVMVFVSRHTPSKKQIELAQEKGYKLVHIGDIDAFSITKEMILKEVNNIEVSAVCVVHAAAALRLQEYFKIGVFKNTMRAEEGKAPTFEASELFIY
jgi:hypothetical protein